MSSSSPVILIFGAGANVGLSIAQKFKSSGYSVVAVARNPSTELQQTASRIYPADLSSSVGQISDIFSKCKADVGIPNVVIYNAYSLAFASGADPLAVAPDAFAKDLAVNTASAYTAAHEAAKCFAELPQDFQHGRTFIYTGNMMSNLIVPETFSLGAGKCAMAYVIETAANVYASQGQSGSKGTWYYGNEMTAEGQSVMSKISGEAHAERYWALANNGGKQEPWNDTFVKGEGYKDFESKWDRPLKRVSELMKQVGG